ncbi:hypothetical protein [Pseudomonas phage Alpheus]|uniref:Scaffolding protein n=1 Tax=Pseudomonas phage Alpheus TaxID=2163983 RepID=A0A2S1GMZ8_9CAUD|nr:head scaffolding protein [Pseudomonas phage Alpheus]AWD90755.1 hypothetical protein [Pseudomonas phage Alpheus]
MATEVEIIDNAPKDGVLDLTGSTGPTNLAEETSDDSSTQTTESETAGNAGEEGANADDVQNKGEGAGEGDGKEGGEEKGDKEGEEGDAPVYHFGDQQVEVEVPSEISAALADAGVDEKALLTELFAEGGKFELSADTRAKLDEKFGKVMVDGYLNLYRGLNQQTIAEHARTTADAAKAAEAQQAEYAELVGGKEGLESLEAFILANFDEKQIGSYNAIMSGDSWEAQRMVISMAKQQMAQHDKLTKGDRSVDLLSDGDPASRQSGDDITSKGFITSAEYNKIMDTDKYWNDRDYQRQVDSLRSQSIRAGK